MLAQLWLALQYRAKWSSLQSSLNAQSHTLQLWFSRVGDHSNKIEQETIDQLSPSENKRLSSTKHPSKQREFLLSRALMRHALSQHFPDQKNRWEFLQIPNAVPNVQNLPDNTFLSLSHSNNMICFAIATCRVGIDLEIKKKRDLSEFAETIMGSEEFLIFSQSKGEQTDIFYRTWCAKEAYYKMLSKHQQSIIGLKQISIFDQLATNNEGFLLEPKIKDYAFAIVTKYKPMEVSQHHYMIDPAALKET